MYRAGIESVHPSQDGAARSLGLSRLQSLRYVVVPQAVRRVIPPLLNDFIGLQRWALVQKFVVFVNPPVVNRELGIRRSYLAEARRVAGEFLRRHLQVIVFAQSRLATEILTTYLKEDFETVPGMAEQIRGYRGGYLPLRRREIEKGLREGQVRGVVSPPTRSSSASTSARSTWR